MRQGEQVSSPPMDPVRVPAIPAATFPLPPRLEGLRRLAYNLYWAWHPRTRGLWSLIDRTAWTRYRNPIPVISGSTEWSRLLDDAEVPGRVPRRPRRVRRVHGERLRPLVPAQVHRRAHRPDRLLLRGVRPPRVARHLLGRPGRPGRRSHEVGQRHGPAGARRRPPLSEGLLPAVDRCRRAPGARLPGLRPGAPADQPGPGPERPAAHGHRRAARPRPGRGGLARPGGPRAGPAARHGPAGEPGPGPADHPHPVRPRPRDAAPPGARARRRGRPRDPGAGPRPGRLAPQRGPLRLPVGGAGPRTRGGRSDARRRLGDRPARQRLHHPYTGLGGQRAVRCRARATRRRSSARSRRRPHRSRPRAGCGDGRRSRSVRHDRLLAAPDQRRQRGQPAPCARPRMRHGAASTTRTSSASPTACTVRRGSERRSATLLARYLDADLDDLDASARQGRFWEKIDRIPGRELWEAHLRQKRELAHFAQSRLRSQFARHGEAPFGPGRARDRRSTRRS